MSNDIYECDNCGHRCPEEDTNLARDLSQRLSPGCTYTDRECPKCGCLTYPTKPFELLEVERAAINSLRNRGCCVVVFNPDELKGADVGYLEEILIERGYNFIETTAED